MGVPHNSRVYRVQSRKVRHRGGNGRPTVYESTVELQDGYRLVVVDISAEFVVAVKKYTAHPDTIFTQSVLQRSVDGSNCFLLTDHAAVDHAMQMGATPLTERELNNPF